MQVLYALNYLHKSKIAHRDIKPQNILIVDGICKLCDFGFAKQVRGDLTSIKGSPVYLSPEIASQQPYNELSDIWSFGIMIFELVCGKPPFISQSQIGLIKFLATDQLKIDYSKYPIFVKTPLLQNFIEVCLQKNPAKRCTAEQLLKHKFLTQNTELLLKINAETAATKRSWY